MDYSKKGYSKAPSSGKIMKDAKPGKPIMAVNNSDLSKVKMCKKSNQGYSAQAFDYKY
jgi:hypothetical protein